MGFVRRRRGENDGAAMYAMAESLREGGHVGNRTRELYVYLSATIPRLRHGSIDRDRIPRPLINYRPHRRLWIINDNILVYSHPVNWYFYVYASFEKFHFVSAFTLLLFLFEVFDEILDASMEREGEREREQERDRDQCLFNFADVKSSGTFLMRYMEIFAGINGYYLSKALLISISMSF